SNIPWSDGFGLHHDRYTFQSPASYIDDLKLKVDDNTIPEPQKFCCPFRFRATKHNLSYPDNQPCNEGKQFPNISKLREHLKKVHSPEYRCSDCNHKFSQVSIAELQDLKASHRHKCPRTGRTPLPGFDMTAEQWDKCKNWSQNQRVDRGSRNGLSERKAAWSWRRIYNSLFATDRITVGPDPCAFKPGPRAAHPQLPRVQPRGPTKGAGPGADGYLGRSAPTYTPSDFVSVFSVDYNPSANGRSSRCMFCKQKLDRDPDAESALSLSCRKCGE
ncbi:unnamed protein product, partial [Clonostachys rhizophaga]